MDAGTVERSFGVDPATESELARRERLADRYGTAFGEDRVFPELVEAMLAEIPEDIDILEVGAAAGLLTRPLLERARHLTAMEPSEGMLRRLLETDVASSDRLTIVKGMVEDLSYGISFDVAVVTFTPRRGVALLRLISELAKHVTDRMVMLLEVDGTMDWAYLARAAAQQGFKTSAKIVPDAGRTRISVVLVVEIGEGHTELTTDDWAIDAQVVDVPFPAPRGSATRLIRYFLSGGGRALLVRTDERGVERLYGNLRTAVHRIARTEVTVRREGNAIQVVRLPPAD